jgi:hypothetical protein
MCLIHYMLRDSKSGGVSLKADVLKLSADANAKVTGDSSLTLTVPSVECRR